MSEGYSDHLGQVYTAGVKLRWAQELSCDWFFIERLQESPQPAGETQATLRRSEKDASAAGSREDQHRGEQDAAVVPAARLQGAVSLHGVVELSAGSGSGGSAVLWRLSATTTLNWNVRKITVAILNQNCQYFNKTCEVVDILLTAAFQ